MSLLFSNHSDTVICFIVKKEKYGLHETTIKHVEKDNTGESQSMA